MFAIELSMHIFVNNKTHALNIPSINAYKYIDTVKPVIYI